ncbi:MAG: tetratricopeptide repeat protein, partial [Paramuribaculum sp.]|nr:tetratricopeptide repeat protein [Paramuribaculum sp.]
MHSLQHIISQIDQNRLDEALQSINEYILIHPDCAQALFLRGKLYWKLGNRAAATANYAAATELDPDGPAAAALEQA